ncbi:MAG: hypothetical protein HY318_06375 [Armatimonadetes bacterium]|nr:hypothetical protein [Armatimonadota bacterium]
MRSECDTVYLFRCVSLLVLLAFVNSPSMAREGESPLSPTYPGGLIIGAITMVESQTDKAGIETGTVHLTVTEVIGGCMQVGDALVDYYIRDDQIVFFQPNPWHALRPRVGLRLLVRLHKLPQQKDRYRADYAELLEKVSTVYLEGQRKIATLLKLPEGSPRLAEIQKMDFAKQQPEVQVFIMEQFAQFSGPYFAVQKISPVFADSQFSYAVRWRAGGLLRQVWADPTLVGSEKNVAIDALMKGLNDSHPGIRDLSLQCLECIAAREDPDLQEIHVNLRVVAAIDDFVKTSEAGDSRKRGLQVQAYIRQILDKIKRLETQK